MMKVTPRPSAEITEAYRKENTLVLLSERGVLALTPVKANIVRVRFAPGREIPEVSRPYLLEQEEFPQWDWEKLPAGAAAGNGAEILLSTEALRVIVNCRTASVRYETPDGKPVARERAEESREMEAFDSYRISAGGKVRVEEVRTADGVKKVVRDADTVFDRRLYHTRVHWEFAPDEALFGLGQNDTGRFNLRGSTQYLHQANMKIAVPMLVSSKGYGILLTTGSPAVFSDSEYGSYLYAEAEEAIDYFFIAGGMDTVIAGYRALTGKAAMLPRWAFGYVQSQERYESQEELENIAAEYHRRGIGLDCVVQDWCSWPDGMWGQKSLDPERYPDPEGMMKTLHDSGVHLLISVWPNMNEKTENHREFADAGLLLPASDIYDALNPEARKLYWDQMNRGLFRFGIDGWWCDSCEPWTPEWSHAIKPEPFRTYDEFCQTAGRALPADLSNAYSYYHAMTVWEGQRAEQERLLEEQVQKEQNQKAQTEGKAAEQSESAAAPVEMPAGETGGKSAGKPAEKRVVNLIRSAYTGQQRFGTVQWSGDISASWESFRRQVAEGLNFCASGLPYWTFDAGCFFIKRGKAWYWNGDYEDGWDNPSYCELAVRSFQFAAFLPMFRGHGTDIRREWWYAGGEDSVFYQALLRINRLRYTLLPYFYSLAGSVVLHDDTMLRMLAFDFASDPQAVGVKDEFMAGRSLLVCPVEEPLYYHRDGSEMSGKLKTRSVYLPEGCDWIDFWTDICYRGGQWIEAEAPISRIPLYVRAGSIIPEAKAGLTSGEVFSQPCTFVVYPGADGRFAYYEDEGDGYGYERGEYAETEIRWNDAEGKLSFGETKGSFRADARPEEHPVEIRRIRRDIDSDGND